MMWSIVTKSRSNSLVRRVLIMVAAGIGLPACATLITDDHQSILITSDPPGATCQVREGGAVVGVVSPTPGTILVGKSRHDIAIDCTRVGYYPGAAVLQPHFQDMTFGNILYGGSIGLLVDTSSGAINEYPRWVSVLMKRQPLPGETAPETERLSAIEIVRHRAIINGDQ
jgi:hypothetical protein